MAENVAETEGQDADLAASRARFDAMEQRLRASSAEREAGFDAMSAALDDLERLLFPKQPAAPVRPKLTAIEGGKSPKTAAEET